MNYLFYRFSPLEQDQIKIKLTDIVKSEGINVTDDGMKALLKLSRGDMRKALNILQSSNSAFDTVSETAVYSCTGAPHPADIQNIMSLLMNSDFTTAFNGIQKIKLVKGLALADILVVLFTQFCSTILFNLIYYLIIVD